MERLFSFSFGSDGPDWINIFFKTTLEKTNHVFTDNQQWPLSIPLIAANTSTSNLWTRSSEWGASSTELIPHQLIEPAAQYLTVTDDYQTDVLDLQISKQGPSAESLLE